MKKGEEMLVIFDPENIVEVEQKAREYMEEHPGRKVTEVTSVMPCATDFLYRIRVKWEEDDRPQEKVKGLLERRELLEALAEEAGELVQAALKLIRAEGLNGNVTPKTQEEARADLEEEWKDVISVAYLLGMDPGKADIENYPKWTRWARRLEEAHDHKEG